jgi:hypothetical protein
VPETPPPIPPPATPPTTPAPLARRTDDEQHVKVLSILYYVGSGLSLLGVCGGIMYTFVGGMVMVQARTGTSDEEVSEGLGWFIGGMGVFVLVLSVIMGVLFFFAALNLGRHRAHTFCLVVAGIACINVPLGTVLGVFTLVVLTRPGVKAMFGGET